MEGPVFAAGEASGVSVTRGRFMEAVLLPGIITPGCGAGPGPE